jgi:hypothetical protein
MKTRALLLTLLFPALSGCDEPSVFNPQPDIGGPRGVIDGTATYVGPAPCTHNGKILGAAAILAFDTRLLPPPEGLGTTAASLDVIPGEVLFDGIRDQLAFTNDGTTACGDPGSPVTVSGSWAVGPFNAGTYQIRGFYDKYGDFDPGFSISNLPTKGDVGGGAIENASAVLKGAAPVYREIQLGTRGADGELRIPEQGSKVSGVSVTLGLPLPLERPMFYSKEVKDESGKNKDPKKITMASDFQIKVFNAVDVVGTEKSFIRIVLGAGLPASETGLAEKSPFNLPLKDPFLLYSRQDVDGDGKITSADHVTESQLIPALFPVAAFVKLNDGARIGSQASPTVLLQGLTLYKDLLSTATAPPDLNEPSATATVALRPAVVCIDTNDTKKRGVLLLTHPDDSKGTLLIPEDQEESVKQSLTALFDRPFDIKYGCLPQGDYSMNLVYGTGQAWTVPNEAGVCAPSEEAGTTTCGTRPRLVSQDVTLKIGKPVDAAYCAKNATPAECLPAPVEDQEQQGN